MKKKGSILWISLLLVLALWVPALAEIQLEEYVTDAAGLLSQEELEALRENSAQLEEDYHFGVYIITLDDVTHYVDAYDMEDAAEQLYLGNELGIGEDQSGLLLLLSMEDRSWALYAFGYGNTAFTDYGKEYLSGRFLDDFREDSWYDGLADYQKACGEMLESAQKGEAVDVDHQPDPPHARVYGILACVVLGVLVAALITLLLKSQLRSVAKGTQAEAFVAAGGLELSQRQDQYTHTTQTRIYDPPEKNNSGGSSGGTTVNSSGGSSASGHF